MSLYDDIVLDLRNAMKEQDKGRLSVLCGAEDLIQLFAAPANSRRD